MYELKKNAVQNYLNIDRSIVRIRQILKSVGIELDMKSANPSDENTIDGQIQKIYESLNDYTFNLLDIDSSSKASEDFLGMTGDYAYGDDSITADYILQTVAEE